MNRLFFFDAHLDQFGPQSGGWGSPQQLHAMHRLGGALRVLFCETTSGTGEAHELIRNAPTDPIRHLSEAEVIKKNIMPRSMPNDWKAGQNFSYHVEGLESASNVDQARDLIKSFHHMGVRGVTPIYHEGNPLGGCSKEPGKGLTPFGFEVLQLIAQRDWWLDLAHMSQHSIADALKWHIEQACRPKVCYTHGGLRHRDISHPALVNGNTERLIDSAQAVWLVENGSLVCLSPARPFYKRLDGPFLEHINMLGEASNWQGVGIGTDYGGILDEWRFPECATVADCFRTVAQFLLDSGLQEWQVRNVVGLNAARFFGLAPA